MPKAEEPVSDDAIRCENCGTMVKRGMRFCTSCGKPMSLPEMPVVSPVEEKSGEKTCPSCGTQIEGNTAFCTECGAKL